MESVWVARRTMMMIALGGSSLAVLTLAACGAAPSAAGTAPSAPARTSGGSAVARTTPPAGATADGARLVTAFTGRLFGILASTSGNVVVSPYSVAVALGMARNGAKGATATQMDTVLGTPSLSSLNAGLNAVGRLVGARSGPVTKADGTKTEVAIKVADEVFAQRRQAWQQPFLDSLARDYGADLQLVDFLEDDEGARRQINAWVDTATSGGIPELVARGVLDGATRMVLVNAIHLKAPWAMPFPAQATVPGPFRRADGSSVSAPMMATVLEDATIGRGPGYAGVQLPYAGGQLAMTVLLPEVAADAAVLDLVATNLSQVLASFVGTASVTLTMPRFRFGFGASLVSLLTDLGMPDAFDPGRADFSGITTEESLFVSDVIHRAVVAVDEEGTEASAATAVVMAESAARQPQDELTLALDRPFVFVIHDVETRTPFFVGRVGDPSAD